MCDINKMFDYFCTTYNENSFNEEELDILEFDKEELLEFIEENYGLINACLECNNKFDLDNEQDKNYIKKLILLDPITKFSLSVLISQSGGLIFKNDIFIDKLVSMKDKSVGEINNFVIDVLRINQVIEQTKIEEKLIKSTSSVKVINNDEIFSFNKFYGEKETRGSNKKYYLKNKHDNRNRIYKNNRNRTFR